MTMANSKDSRKDTAASSSSTPQPNTDRDRETAAEIERIRNKFRNFLCSLGLVRCSITICALVLERADPDSRADIAHFLRTDARARLDEEVAAAKTLLGEFRPDQATSRRPASME
jgi:hypothetical protein